VSDISQTLFEQFSAAARSLPEHEIPDAIDAADHVFLGALRDHGMETVFPPFVVTGRPVDRVLAVFQGHTLGEVADVMRRLRHELAEAVVRGGAPEDVVRELRDGGPWPDGQRGDTG
jgi:hypothetical protein